MSHDLEHDLSTRGSHIGSMIVFGLDDSGRPHAGWFEAHEAALAQRAAEALRMQTLAVTTQELQIEVDKLPQGRVFASGRAFVPFAKVAMYARLKALSLACDEPQTVSPSIPPGPGQVATERGEGRGDDATALAAPQVPEVPHSGSSHLPISWDQIRMGSLVLAPDDDEQSWWPAVVMSVRAKGKLELRWRDWFDEPAFMRHRHRIALLNPSMFLPE